MTNINIVGDSHIGKLSSSADLEGQGIKYSFGVGKNFLAFDTEQTDEKIIISSAKVAGKYGLYAEILPTDTLVLSAPLHSSPVSRHPTWKTFCHWTLTDQFPDMDLMSDDTINMIAERRNATTFEFLELARSYCEAVYVLEPPRLAPQAAALAEIDPVILADIDQRYRDRVKLRLAEISIPVIETPPETHDGTSMLPMYCRANEADVHHGNDQYLSLMLASVLEEVRGK